MVKFTAVQRGAVLFENTDLDEEFWNFFERVDIESVEVFLD